MQAGRLPAGLSKPELREPSEAPTSGFVLRPRLNLRTDPGLIASVPSGVEGRSVLGFIMPQRLPPVGIALPGDRAQAEEWHVVSVDEEVLTGRPVQQPTPGSRCPDGVAIPRSTPPGMAQLQLIAEQVAHAEQPLAPAFQQDAECPGV
jgi:hypothetical protein